MLRGDLLLKRDTSVRPTLRHTQTHTETHTRDLQFCWQWVKMTEGYEWLWHTADPTPPPCFTPESNTGVFVLAPPSVTIHHGLTCQPCAKLPLRLNPKPEAKAPESTTTRRPHHCLSPSPRAERLLPAVITSYIMLCSTSHYIIYSLNPDLDFYSKMSKFKIIQRHITVNTGYCY